MSYKITLIPGDGIGPEVTQATLRVIRATGVKIDVEEVLVGERAIKEHSSPLPQFVIDCIRKNKVALKGPVTTPIGYGFRSINVALRKVLNLYAGIRPCKLFPGVPSRYEGVDIVIIRENTEDLYVGVEFEKESPALTELINFVEKNTGEKFSPKCSIGLKVISEEGSRRIVHFAFDYALKNGRRKVSVVHKANILKFSDGLFLSVAKEVAQNYPQIEFEDILIDNLCQQLVLNPGQFDVLVLPNLYGDIVSDLCAGLVGGLGVVPGANIGDEYAIFEPVHGSAPQIAGKNIANPIAMILSGALMLAYLGEGEAAQRIERAVARVIKEGKKVTFDLKRDNSPPSTTMEVAEAIVETLSEV